MILFVGPLPPPVHGFSWVNRKMFDALSKCAQVVLFDRAPRYYRSASKSRIFVPISIFLQLLNFFSKVISDRTVSVYLGLSGGLGICLDLVFVVIAKLFCRRVYLHHHSYSYLNKKNFLYSLSFFVLRNCQHIVLCDCMSSKLMRTYSVLPENIYVLSNSAFLEPFGVRHFKEDADVVVGFLSNITEEKGIFDFLALADLFGGSSNIKFRIAGPVDAGIEKRFFDCIEGKLNLDYVGPVYGEEKEAYFKSLDILAFPTLYENEAEPVTIFEALRNGIPVLANSRGCIEGMLDHLSGIVVKHPSGFVKESAEFIFKFNESRALRVDYKTGAYDRFAIFYSESFRKFNNLVASISRGDLLGG